MGRRLCGPENYPAPLLAVAAFGLDGTRHRPPDQPLEDDRFGQLLEDAAKYRVTGWLMAAIGAGALPASDEQARVVRAIHGTQLVRMMMLERELLGIIDVLTESGIETRVLKGCAVAHLDYPDPALRSFIDLDVLVRARDIDRTAAVLTASGFRRTLAEPQPGFDRRFDKGMTLVPAAGYELDLHRTFVLGPWGALMRLDQLWDEGEEFTLAGRRLRALSGPNRFMHACFHAALGDWPLRLGSLRDVVQMLPGLDEAKVRQLATDWRAEAVVASAVADAERLLALPPVGALSRWARDYRPTDREVAWLALHTHAGKTFAAQAVATVRVLPWRDRAAYLRALVLPDAQYTAGRHATALSRFGYALREVRRGRWQGGGAA